MPASGWRGGVQFRPEQRDAFGQAKVTINRSPVPTRLRLCATCGLALRAAAAGRTDQPAGVPAGQLIRMLRPSPFRDTWTSSASPAITARPSCAA